MTKGQAEEVKVNDIIEKKHDVGLGTKGSKAVIVAVFSDDIYFVHQTVYRIIVISENGQKTEEELELNTANMTLWEAVK